METMEAMELPTPTSSIPSDYTVTPRPAVVRKQSTIPARLVADLDATLRSGQALCFPIDGLDDRQINRLASRLNGVGRRSGNAFTVKTRRADGQLFAWAVPKQIVKPRQRKAVAAEAE